MDRLHVDELPIDLGLARRLVDGAFPELRALPLRPVAASGSSNALFRLGEDLVVRMPRQPGGGAAIEKEARWLPVLSGHLSAAVPRFVGVGRPAHGYPERWAVTTWLGGATPVAGGAGGASTGLARDLARFVRELRAAPLPTCVADDHRLSSYRAESLDALDDTFRQAVAACRPLRPGLDLDRALLLWDRAVEAASDVRVAPTWLHGDLLAENLVVDHAGRLSAVLDFGGLAVGSPIVDLVVAWELLDAESRGVFRRALDVDEDVWTVSRGWALLIALITFPYYRSTMPGRCADRLVMARAALAGGAGTRR